MRIGFKVIHQETCNNWRWKKNILELIPYWRKSSFDRTDVCLVGWKERNDEQNNGINITIHRIFVWATRSGQKLGGPECIIPCLSVTWCEHARSGWHADSCSPLTLYTVTPLRIMICPFILHYAQVIKKMRLSVSRRRIASRSLADTKICDLECEMISRCMFWPCFSTLSPGVGLEKMSSGVEDGVSNLVWLVKHQFRNMLALTSME